MDEYRCEYLGCTNPARRADVERRLWHNDQRPIYCDRCSFEIDENVRPARPTCTSGRCRQTAITWCCCCGRLICSLHRRYLFDDTPATHSARACPECKADPHFYDLVYQGHT